MPSETPKQAAFFRLVKFFKKHHRMPPGAGSASAKVKEAASGMSLAEVNKFLKVKKKA